MDLRHVLFLLKILIFTEANEYVKEYFFSYPFQSDTIDNDHTGLTIYNPNAFQVNIRARTPSISALDINFTIQPDETEVISTKGDIYQMDKTTGKHLNGILISSTDSVIVFAAKIISESRDAFVVPASTDTGTHFVSVTAFEYLCYCFVVVCTTFNDTLINFKLPATLASDIQYDGVWYSHGEIVSVNLKRFDCFQIVEQIDLTGIFINSTKNITVLSGTVDFYYEEQSNDYVIGNIPPLSSLGRLYIIQPSGLDLIKIVSTTPKSIISIIGTCLQKKYELKRAQEFVMYEVKCTLSITANNPILVSHIPFPASNLNPAMYAVTPVEHYNQFMVVYTPIHNEEAPKMCKIFISAYSTNKSDILININIQARVNWTWMQTENFFYAYSNVVVNKTLVKIKSIGIPLGGYVVCEPSRKETAAVPFIAIITNKPEDKNFTQTTLDSSSSFTLQSSLDFEGIQPTTLYDPDDVSTVWEMSETLRQAVYVTTASTFPTVMEGSVSAFKTISAEKSVLDVSNSEIYSSYSTDDHYLSSTSRLQIRSASSMYIKNTEITRQNYSQKECFCDKQCATALNSSQEFNETSLNAIIEKLRQELTVNRKQTSTWVRSKISADDSRPSAKGIGGTLCLITVCVVFGIIIVPDIITFSNYIRQMLKKQKESAAV